MSEEKKKLTIDESIDMIESALQENEKLYSEIKDIFDSKVRKKMDGELTISGGGNSNSRDIIELSKTLTTVRNNSITGHKSLFDAVKERELLELKKEEIKIKRESMEQANQQQSEYSQIVRQVLANAKINNEEVVKTLVQDERVMSDAKHMSTKATKNVLSNIELSESEKNMVSQRNNKNSDNPFSKDDIINMKKGKS